MHHEAHHASLPLETLKQMSASVAAELTALGGSTGEPVAATGGGSAHRALPADLQQRFIALRTALFQRGVYDPVLGRFDTASAPQASTGEIAAQLTKIAESL
jgi:hypothetical protein